MTFRPLFRSGLALALAAGLLSPSPVRADDDDRKHHRWDRHHDRGWDDDRRWDRDGRGRHDRRWSHDHHWDDRYDRFGYRDGYRDGRRDQRRWDRYDDRRDGRHDGRGRVIYREVYRVPAYAYGPHDRYGYAPPTRHYGPPRWARGYRIHDYGWAPTYVVVDYHRYGLRHPPRGYHWRRDDRGDWLLVAIATGVIADVIFR
jgi:Ni/Co efflux regulator RcnB